MNYTTIDHDARLKFGLSCNDYCVADKIYNLSNNPKNDTRWCFAGRGAIGEMLGISRQSIIKIIKTLVEKNLVEIHPETGHLRTTEAWYRNFTPCKESLHPPVKKVDSKVSNKFTPPCKESLHPSYNKSLQEDLQEETTTSKEEKIDDGVDAENCLSNSVDENRATALEAKKEKRNPPALPPPLTWPEAETQMLDARISIEAKAMNLKISTTQVQGYMTYFVREQIGRGKPAPEKLEDALSHFSNWLPFRLKEEKKEAEAEPKGRITSIKEGTRRASEKLMESLMDGTFKNPLFDFKT